MKQYIAKLVAISAVLLIPPAISFAAGISLTNGGFGQIAANPQQFGVAVCNSGPQTLTQSVPISVNVNGANLNLLSAASINAGACEYSYASYNQLGMEAGQTYSVSVAIDPAHTVTSNTSPTTYNITVPGQVVLSANQTADISTQLNNPLTTFWDWVVSFFKRL